MPTAFRDMQILDNTNRAEKVLALRRERKTWKQIGRELGVSRETVRQDYLAVLRDAAKERLEAGDIALEEHLAELEEVAAKWHKAMFREDADGKEYADEKAAAIYLRTMDQIARLKSLYPKDEAPQAAPQTLVLQWTTVNTGPTAALPDGADETVVLQKTQYHAVDGDGAAG